MAKKSDVLDEFVTVKLSHDVHPIPCGDGRTVLACQRCGAKPGTARIDGPCKSYQLPNEEFERPRPRRPRAYHSDGSPRENSDTFHEFLEEYFNTADYVGGLVSRFGRDLEGWTPGGGTVNALPPYLKMPKELLARLSQTFKTLSKMGDHHITVLKGHYEGRPVDGNQDSVEYAHRLFETLLGPVGRAQVGKRKRVLVPVTALAPGNAKRQRRVHAHLERLNLAEESVGHGKSARFVGIHSDVLQELTEEFRIGEQELENILSEAA